MITYPPALLTSATKLLDRCRAVGIRCVTAESCTGGLLAGLLTEIPGSSDVFDRGFVSYSNQAKAEMFTVPAKLLVEFGAVSEPVALAMAEGALRHSEAEIAVSITGIAGPSGGSPTKPVGLVYLAVCKRVGLPTQSRLLLTSHSRNEIREQSVGEALRLLHIQLDK